MAQPPDNLPPDQPLPPPGDAALESPAPLAPITPSVPVKRATKKPAAPASPEDPEHRRDFFSDAMREALLPFAGIIERKINPLLAALEALPNDLDRLTNVSLPVVGSLMDQPQSAPTWPSTLPKTVQVPVNDRFLRPPGAMPPGEFETLCSRCGKCAEVCPAQAIRLDPYNIIADGLPYVDPITQPCVVCDSLACMNNCPSGALKPLDRLKINMGTAKVDRDACVRESGEDCRRCVHACPILADNDGHEDALFIHSETGRIRVRKNVCIGCGLCEVNCPTDPPAIIVQPYRPPVDPIIA